MNLRSAFSLFAALAVGGIAFAAEATEAMDEPQGPEDPLIQAVVTSSTGFAAALYSELRGQAGNLVFAPLGLSQALLPVAAGTRGPTEAELAKVLHLAVPVVDAADGFAVLTRRLQRAAGGEGSLSFAKALWVQQWNTIDSDYVEVLREHCRSELRVIDFSHGAYAARWINKWAAERTGDTLPTFTDLQTFDASTRLVVGNAVCFNSDWKYAFDPAQTTASSFVVAPESSPIEVPTMRQLAPYRLVARPGCRLLQLPYRGDRLALVVLLPDRVDGLPQIEAGLTAERIAEWLHGVQQADAVRVDLTLPRFRADRPLSNLAAALREMGAKQVFEQNGSADFSGLGTNFDGEPVYLSVVSHFARFAIGERGTAAAAATATAAPLDTPTARLTEPPEPVQAATAFHVDHPFLFFICDPTTGSLLFMGRVVDPRAG